MDPFQMLNNDMSQLIMSTKPIMEQWNDNNSTLFNTQCIGVIRNKYNRYVELIEAPLRNYMIHERKCQDGIKRLQELKENK